MWCILSSIQLSLSLLYVWIEIRNFFKCVIIFKSIDQRNIILYSNLCVLFNFWFETFNCDWSINVYKFYDALYKKMALNVVFLYRIFCLEDWWRTGEWVQFRFEITYTNHSFLTKVVIAFKFDCFNFRQKYVYRVINVIYAKNVEWHAHLFLRPSKRARTTNENDITFFHG